MAKKKTYTAQLSRDGMMCAIPVPFDPTAVFGKVRAPVYVTLNGYTFRSTIAKYGDDCWIPLRKSNREAAGLEGDEKLTVTLSLDEDERIAKAPPDLVKALKASPSAWERWQELSFSHQREHIEAVEGAKKPETRQRRLDATVAMLVAAAPKKKKATATRAK